MAGDAGLVANRIGWSMIVATLAAAGFLLVGPVTAASGCFELGCVAVQGAVVLATLAACVLVAALVLFLATRRAFNAFAFIGLGLAWVLLAYVGAWLTTIATGRPGGDYPVGAWLVALVLFAATIAAGAWAIWALQRGGRALMIFTVAAASAVVGPILVARLLP